MLRLGRVLRTAALHQQLRCQSGAQATAAASGDALPERCDVLIIGGGGMGASSAYWLKCRTQHEKLNVLVVERDACVSYFRSWLLRIRSKCSNIVA